MATVRRNWRQRTSRGRTALTVGLALFSLGLLSAGAFAADAPFTDEIASTFSSADNGSSTHLDGSSDSTAIDSTAASGGDSATTSDSTDATASSSTDSSNVPFSYIVTFASGVSRAQQSDAIAAAGATDVSSVPALRMHVVEASDAALATLESDSSVARVEANAVRTAEGTPSDSLYEQQWSLQRIGWDQVYPNAVTGSATVAVLDTGVDASHPDLDGNVVAGSSILSGSNWDSDQNGHGTALAGIVAAETGNDAGVAGVGYSGVSVMPVTVLGADGTGADGDIIEGVVWAADHGADVILMAFSNDGYSASLQAAIDYAWDHGAVLVAATGNSSSSTPTFPAGDRGVIGVAGTDALDALASSSNSGEAAFMAAPGVNILSTSAGGGYSALTGTSAAAAEVAGAAALLRAASGVSNGVVVGRLARNADPAGSPSETGNGRLNLARAMSDASTESVQPAGAAPVGGGGPFLGPYTIAAGTVNSAAVDGGATTTVVAGASIAASVTVTSQNGNANNRIGSIGWRIATTAPGTVTCLDVTDVSNQNNQVRTFNITAPATNGTYNAYFIGYSDNACTANASNTLTLTNGVVVAAANPVPTTTNISPTSRVAGDGAFTLTVTGTNFVANSVVRVGGSDRPTTFFSATQLTASIPGGDTGSPGTKSITVFNPAPVGGTSNAQTLTVTACTSATRKICIDGSMADWAALTTTPSFPDNSADAGGGSTDITAVRMTAGDGNLYVRWDETLTSNKNKIASDGFSMTVDANRDGTPDARVWILFDSSGIPTVQVERPFGTFVTVGSAQQTCNVVVCANGSTSSIEASVPLTALNATGAVVGLQAETRASASTNSSVKDCVPGPAVCNGYFNLDTDTGIVTVDAGHVTTTGLNCPQSTITVGFATSTCTVTVVDTGVDTNGATVTKANPTGTVNFLVSGGSGTFIPASCTLSPAAGFTDRSTCTLTYTPTTVGTGTHTLKASYAGDTSPIQFASSSGTDTVTVVPANVAPVCTNDSGSTNEDTPLSDSVSCTDADGNTLTYSVVSTTTHGTLSLNASTGAFTYTPNSNYFGPDSFTFRANDGTVNSNTATYSITVNSINDAPVANDDSYTQNEDSTLVVPPNLGVLANDSDVDNGTPTAVLVDDVGHGSLSLASDGGFAYAPAPNFCGTDTFTYRANDGQATNNLSNVATVTLAVSCVNDAPVNAVPPAQSTNEDTAKIFSAANSNAISVSDTDASSDDVRVTLGVANGSLTLSQTTGLAFSAGDGTSDASMTFSGALINVNAALAGLRYDPAANYNGSDTLTVTSNDLGHNGSGGAKSDTDTVGITVRPVNDKPTAAASPASLALDEDDPGSTVELSGADVETAGTALTFTITQAPAHGSLKFGAMGLASGDTLTGSPKSVVYKPAADYNGPDSFKFNVTDSGDPAGCSPVAAGVCAAPLDSAEQTVAISISAVNDAPVAVDDSASTVEDAAVDVEVSANDTDGDDANAALRVNAGSIASVHGGTATLLADGRTVRFTPAANANDGNTPGGFGFTYKAYDGALASANAATVSISVAAVNDAPVAVDDSASTDEDSPVEIEVSANDTDVDNANAVLRVSAGSIANVHGGTATLLADGRTVRFTPAANANDGNTPGGFGFTYKAYDGALASANTASVSISVAAVNDAPVAVNDAASTNEDTAVDTDVVANDTDVDDANGDLRVVAGSIGATNGSAALLGDGRTIRFTPAANKNNGNVGPGGFTVTYKVTDGSLESNTATLTISVAAVNDAPVAVDDSASTDEDTSVDVEVSANDTDVDNANGDLRVQAGSIASVHGGTATLLADGRTVRFTPTANANNGNTPGGFGFAYKAYDGALVSANEANVSISVAAVNDAPIAVDDSASTDEDTFVDVAVSANDTDVDNANADLRVKTDSIDDVKGGSAVLLADGRTVRFTPAANANNGNTPGGFGFTYKAYDGALASANAASVSISVAAVNDAPVAVDDSASTDEDTSVDVAVSANDTDVDNANGDLRVQAGSIANVHGGTATLLADGRTVRFTPAANANNGNTPGGFGFTYKAYDGALASANTASVSISVAAVNDAPVAEDDSASTDEDTAVDKDVVTNDTDVDNANAQLSVKVGSLAATNGSAVLLADGRTIRFTPAANRNDGNVGPAGFAVTYKTTDGSLESNTATLTISVAAVNDAPVAEDDSASTDEDTAVDKDVVTNDTDVDNANADLRVKAGSLIATNGSATLLADGRTIRFTPALNKNDGNVGPAGFTVTYKATDGSLESNTATLTLSVAAVNDAPVAEDDSASTNEDTAVDKDVVANDTDVDNANAQLSVQAGSLVATNGSATLLADGRTIRFTPAANKNDGNVGPAGFTVTYKATDGSLESNTATLTISVAAVNDAPTAEDGNASVDEDGSTNVDLRALVADVETADANLTYTIVSGPAHGTLSATATTGVRTYSPAADYNGSDSFTYQVTDRGDPDGCGAAGPACDGPETSAVKSVSITINPVNDKPVANDGAASVSEDGFVGVDLAAKVSDKETGDDDLTYDIVAAPTHGTLVPGLTPGSYTYLPAANYNGADSFSYDVTDRGDPDGCSAAPCAAPLTSDTKTISITVNAVNDTPSAADGAASVDEDSSTDVDLRELVADVETADGNLTYTIVSGPSYGTLSATAANGVRRYVPAPDYNGGDSFTYKVTDRGDPDNCNLANASCDGPKTSGTKTVSITVNPVNDAPVAVNDAATTDEDIAVDIEVSANDTDVDDANGDLRVDSGSIANVKGGSAVLLADGRTVRFTPAANANNSNTPGGFGFTYKAHDGELASANQATVSISVAAVNDAPVAVNDSANTNEDTSVDVPVSANDADVDNANADLRVKTGSIANVHGGTATLLADGRTVRFTPTLDANNGNTPGEFGFTYKASDGALPSANDATVSISVAPVNDAPVLGAIGDRSVDEETELSFSATATDVDSTNLTFSLLGAPAGATIDPSTGAFSWTPTEAQGPNSYTFKVRVTDDASSAAYDEEQITVTVREVNRAPQLAAIADKQVNEETQLAFTAQGSDPDIPANTLAYSLVGASHGATINPATGAFSWTPTEAQGPASYTFTIKVSDGSLSAARTFQVQVSEVNRAPSLGAFATPASGVWGKDLTFTATATDPDLPANTLTFSLVNAPSGATINPSSGAFSWTPTSAQIASHTFTVKVTDDGSPNLSDTRSVTIVVGKRATKLVYDGATGGVYSDPATVSATLRDDSPGGANNTPIGGKTIAFTLGTQSTSAATGAATGVASGSITLNQPAGTPTVKAAFATDAYYLASEDSKTFTIAKETMELEYTGQTFLTTSKVGGTLTTQLSAKVTEQQDGTLGTKAWSTIPLQVKFTVQNTAGTALGSCTANVAQGAGGTGTAACTSVALKADNYVIQIELVTNGYYAADAENAALTVNDPGTGFTTGGGWILDPNTNAKSNFGFTVKFLKSGSIQGNSLFIYRTKADLGGKVPGALPGLRDYNFIVKSNAMDSLNQKCATPTGGMPCKATFTGKSNVRAVDRITGVSYTLGADVIGNQQYFQVDVTDNGEPGASSSTNPDQYAIRVWTSAGTYYQVGTPRATIDSPSDMLNLRGGNVQIKP